MPIGATPPAHALSPLLTGDRFGVSEASGRPLFQPARFAQFDAIELSRTQPNTEVSVGFALKQLVLHPFNTLNMARHLLKGSHATGEGFFARMGMMQTLEQALGNNDLKKLETLLDNGTLSDHRSDTQHSTLYHLTAMLTTPRAEGFDKQQLLRDTIAILHTPQAITQKFSRLSANARQALLDTHNNATQMTLLESDPAEGPLSAKDVDRYYSNTCVASSVMYSVAAEQPAEFARHIAELTSPMRAFHETVKLSDIAETPEAALEVLNRNQVRYTPLPTAHGNTPSEPTVTVRVDLPRAAQVRAVNAGQKNHHFKTRSGVESAYQSALSFLASARTYDPADDTCSDTPGGPRVNGLNADQADLMQSIVLDTNGSRTVTVQVTGPTLNPTADQSEDMPSLFGYRRSFKDTAQDILRALDTGQSVLVGTVPVAENGVILGGHETRITGAFVDDAGALYFEKFDSDDDNTKHVNVAASTFIPTMHHMALPKDIARDVQSQMTTFAQAQPGRYQVAGDLEKQEYQVVPTAPEPLPAESAFENNLYPEAMAEALTAAFEDQPAAAPPPGNGPPAMAWQAM